MSKIEWTDRTWCPNQGCTQISEGCKNCYAKKMHKRLRAMGIEKYQNDFSEVQLWLQALTEPTKWKKPSKVFVNSMSDTFHGNLTFEQINEVFNTMQYCNRHTYQVLTKRPDRALEFIQWKRKQPGIIHNWELPDNIWFGVTVENQEQANKRIPILLEIPAKVRFVSVEPMLSNVDLNQVAFKKFQSWLNGNNQGSLDWVICGGESGHNARPMHPDWVRNLKDQCDMFKTPFFFKQWGEWWPGEKGRLYREKSIDYTDGQQMIRAGKKLAGCEIDGKEYKQFPK